MRRILVLAKTYDGYGAEMMQIRIGNYLAEKGHEITFCSFFDSKENHMISEKSQRICLISHKSKNFLIRNIQIFLFCPWFLLKCHRKNRFDYILTFKENPLCVALLVKLFAEITLIHSERDNPYNRDTLASKFKMWLYRFADMIVFQTEGARNYFNNIVRNKSVIIPNFVTIPETQWTQQNAGKTIVSIGRLDIRYKRQDILIEAFAKIRENYSDWRLRLYGDGNDKEILKSLCSRMNVSDSVEFLGKVPNASGKITSDGIFVLTSDTEGIPNALMEAMALGMPVISTDCEPGGARLLIKNNTNGILVNRGDKYALLNAIQLLIVNSSLACEMGKSARESMKAYTESTILPQWDRIFN